LAMFIAKASALNFVSVWPSVVISVMGQDYSFISNSSPREIDAAREADVSALEKLLLHRDICSGLVLLRPQTSGFLFGF
jgi:hypothetical protein